MGHQHPLQGRRIRRLAATTYLVAVVAALAALSGLAAATLVVAAPDARAYAGIAGVAVRFAVSPSLTASRLDDSSLLVRSNTAWVATLQTTARDSGKDVRFTGGPTGARGATLRVTGRIVRFTVVAR